MQDKLQADIKSAMIAGDSLRVDVLKSLKSAIQNYRIEKRDELSDEDMTKIVQKEVKKRNEAAELYEKANETTRQEKELKEADILSDYLPAQLSDERLNELIDEVLTNNSITDVKQVGQAIGLVSKKAGAGADGSRIAAAVKLKLGL